VRLFVCWFVCRKRVVVGHRLTGARELLLAATRGRSDAETPGQRVSQMLLLCEKFPLVNAPQSFHLE